MAEVHGAHNGHKKPLVTLSDLTYLSYPFVPLRGLCAFARFHGALQYRKNKHLAAAVRNNLATASVKLSDGELQAKTRRFFEYSSLRNLLFMLSPKLSDEKMLKMFSVDRLDRLDRAIAAGKGVILLASHLNSVSVFMLVIMLRRRGYDIRVAFTVGEDNWSSSRFRTLLNKITGGRTYFEHMGAFSSHLNIRPIVRALSEGAAVLQTGDGWHSAGFIEVDFLGRRLPFTNGMLRVAQETGATVVPIFTDGAPPDRLIFKIEEPFTVPKSEPVDASVTSFAKQLEHYLKQNLECWEHWRVPNALETLASVPKQSLENRYKI